MSRGYLAPHPGGGAGRSIRSASAFRSPLYHMEAFRLSNPWVQWAIAHGAYVDLDNRPVCAQDFGDPESRRIAERLGTRIRDGWQLR